MSDKIIIEVRKNHFSKLYSIRFENTETKEKTIYSKECKWGDIKKWCSHFNIVCPNISDIKLFSDGFNYSYGWFDKQGKVIGKTA